MSPDRTSSFEVVFLEQLQRLLAEGDFSSTYKFAVLIALSELAVETYSPVTGYRDTVTTDELARRVLGVYWPQVRPIAPAIGDRAVVLKQNSGQQANILTVLTELVGRVGPIPADALPQRVPDAHEDAIRRIEWKLVEMPLPRLQRLPSGHDRFLYDIAWDVADVEPRGGRLKREVERYQRGQVSDFDNRIRFRPRVAATLARLHGLVRQLVEARWLLEVRKLNRLFLRDPDLHQHLFGTERVALARVRGPLREHQGDRCFYCDAKLRDAPVAVDHFLPWARYPDDRIENLVVADARCNGSKGHHLPSTAHVDRWLPRFAVRGRINADLHEIATRAGWPEGNSATLAIAHHLYAQHPESARLWHGVNEFRPWRPAALLDRLNATLSEARMS